MFLTVDPIEVAIPPPTDTDSEGEEEEEKEIGADLKEALLRAEECQAKLTEEVGRLQELLEREREKSTNLNCSQLSEFDSALISKDEEIEQLKKQLRRLSGGAVPREVVEVEDDTHASTTMTMTAPPPSQTKGTCSPC